jgi:hypothetical protein
MANGLKIVVVVGVVALVLFFLITQPTQSADLVHKVLGWLKYGAEALVTFLKALFA